MTRPEATAVIADDETAIRQHLKRQLQALWPELDIVGEAGNGPEALELIQARRPAVAFLDIRMPGLSGLEVAERLPPGCRVVFITAYDEFALRAFEHAAVDYLLKPLSDERLEKTIQRLSAQLAQPADTAGLVRRLGELLGPAAAPPPRLKWIRASLRDDIRIVAVEEVLFFRADEKYTSVITADEELLIRKPIKALEEELDPERFWRVHRGIIVNAARIVRTRRDFAGRLWVELAGREEPLPVSRGYAHLFKQM